MREVNRTAGLGRKKVVLAIVSTLFFCLHMAFAETASEVGKRDPQSRREGKDLGAVMRSRFESMLGRTIHDYKIPGLANSTRSQEWKRRRG